MNVYQQMSVAKYKAQLQQCIDELNARAPSFELLQNTRCDHDWSCMNGYRTLCCRVDLYVEYVPAGGGVP